MPFSLPLTLPLLVLTACGPKVTNQNIDALNSQFTSAEKTGKSISLKEVESIMGPPTRTESFPIEMRTVKELPGVRYYYEQDGQTVVLHFIDNKLIRRVLRFGEDASEEKDRPGFKTPLRALPDPETKTESVDSDSRAESSPPETPPAANATPAPKAEIPQPAPPLPDKPN